MSNFDASSFLNHLPHQPGIYQMLNHSGEVIYVGKARDLKKRVSSYFQRQLETKTQTMMLQVENIETTITANENDALLLEANLIKQLRPKYNVLLRDDKSYPYLYLSVQQKYPRLDFYRGSRKGPGRYFGPYPSAGSVRENLALVQKLFKLRQCSDTFFRNRTRPCLQYQIKRCTGPCVGYVSEKDYCTQVNDAILFLEGKNEEVIKELTDRMDLASKSLNYEKAAHLRDQIRRLRVLQKVQVISSEAGDVDVIGIAQQAGKTCFAILFIRAGRVLGSKSYFPNTPPNILIHEALEEFLPQYYLSPLRGDNLPQRIAIAENLTDRHWIENALSIHLGQKIQVSLSQRAPYRQWQCMARINAEQALSQQLAQKDSAAQKLKSLQQALKIPNNIERVECFDISHTMGEATVASCVVFGIEGAIRSNYRRFNIKNIVPGDDYAAMHQALLRRYKRLKESGDDCPDLLLIDGGRGQLKKAVEVLEELQISGICLVSIAKGEGRKPGLEKLYKWGETDPIIIAADNMALHAIQQIRDEAHRFAISSHRQQRAKARMTSPLQRLVGIGPKRCQALLKYFGGIQAVKKASIEEIARVPGISEKVAKMIFEALQ